MSNENRILEPDKDLLKVILREVWDKIPQADLNKGDEVITKIGDRGVYRGVFIASDGTSDMQIVHDLDGKPMIGYYIKELRKVKDVETILNENS
jgi:hypothetical protein